MVFSPPPPLVSPSFRCVPVPGVPAGGVRGAWMPAGGVRGTWVSAGGVRSAWVSAGCVRKAWVSAGCVGVWGVRGSCWGGGPLGNSLRPTHPAQGRAGSVPPAPPPS